MRPRLNKFHYVQLDAIKKDIERRFPNLIVGFYLKDFHKSSMAVNADTASSIFESHGEDLVWRLYRKSDTPDKNIWDVDQVNSINKPIKHVLSKSEIPAHHIDHTIEEDIMKRNQMLFEVVEDEDGNFRLNTNEKGLVECYINFEEDPDRS